MVIKKHIIHNFSFYIYKKINIKKLKRWKKKLNIKLIFFYQEKWESCIFYLKKSDKMNLYLTFYFFYKQK